MLEEKYQSLIKNLEIQARNLDAESMTGRGGSLLREAAEAIVELSEQNFCSKKEKPPFSFIYSYTFVSNEPSTISQGKTTKSVFAPFEHTPIVPGTVTGIVYLGVKAIQTFVHNSNGGFSFLNNGEKSCTHAIDASLDADTGEFSLIWNEPPGKNHVTVSYEYDAND